MRPTDSSLGPPRWLVGAFGLFALVALASTAMPDEWLLYRVRMTTGMPEHSARLWMLDEELVNWDRTLPWYALRHPSALPRFVVITDPTLPGCQRLSREVFRDHWSAQQLSTGFTCTRVVANDPASGIEAASADSVMALYHVTTLPTILFLDRDGTEEARITGYPGRDQIMHEALPRAEFRNGMRRGD